MKALSFIMICFFSLVSAQVFSQNEVGKSISEAQTAYQAKKYEDARFALQQALAELDKITAQEIAKMLPKEHGDIKQTGEDEIVSGMGGIMGASVGRNYANADQSKEVQLNVATNSPLIGSINMILTNPMIGASMGDGNKVVKIGTRKAMLEATEEQYRLSVPMASNSLISFEFRGFASEQEVMAFAQTLDYAGIGKLLGE